MRRTVWDGTIYPANEEDGLLHNEILDLNEIGFEEKGIITGDNLRPPEKGHELLVSSLTENGLQAPVIDLDLPCRLVESSTKGHYHLYIDKEIHIDQYIKIIDALVEAGIVQEIHGNILKEVRQLYVRAPSAPKRKPQHSSRSR